MKPLIDTFITNYEKMKQCAKWESHLIRQWCAILLTNEGIDVSEEEILKRRQQIKEQVSMFSNFRGVAEWPMATMLAMDHARKQEMNIQQIQDVYEKLRKAGFKYGHTTPLLAYQIRRTIEEEQQPILIQRSQQFFEQMKKRHRWLTSVDDYPFAIMLGFTSLPIEETIEEIEQCYAALNKQGFWKGNTLQSMSQILALSPEPIEVKVHRVGQLQQLLREEKLRPEYAALPLLALLALSKHSEALISELVEGEAYLRKQKGFGFFVGKNGRLLLLLTLLANRELKNHDDIVVKSAVSNAMEALILAQEAAMIAAMVAITATSSDSSGQ